MIKKNFIIIVLSLLTSCRLSDFSNNISSFIKNKIPILSPKKSSDDLNNKDNNIINLPPIPKINYNTKQVLPSIPEKKIKSSNSELEAKRNFFFINELYRETIKRTPYEQETQKWMNTLLQGATREGIYRAIVYETEYTDLEEGESFFNKKQTNSFIKTYFKKYIGLEIQEDSIKNMNIFSLKKITTEKSLEIVDLLMHKPEHLYNWYAVFSAEMSRKYPSLWKLKIRKKEKRIYYKKHAQKMKFDHIKSEVIIRLNRVINHLIKEDAKLNS